MIINESDDDDDDVWAIAARGWTSIGSIDLVWWSG